MTTAASSVTVTAAVTVSVTVKEESSSRGASDRKVVAVAAVKKGKKRNETYGGCYLYVQHALVASMDRGSGIHTHLQHLCQV